MRWGRADEFGSERFVPLSSRPAVFLQPARTIRSNRRVATAIEDSAALEEIGDLALKGLSQAVAVYNVVR